MTKKGIIVFVLAALLLPWTAKAQVTCDSGSPVTVSNADTATSTSGYIPGYSLYNYSFSEVLILADDLAGIGDIKALQFKPASTSAGSYFTNCEIYLANTDLEDLSAGFLNDASAFELVWSGNMSYTTTDWQTIEFDDPFAYDGTSNLIVAVRRNHGSWTSGSSFAAFAADAQLARYVYQDSGPYTIGSLPSGTATSTVAWYKLIGCEGTGDFCYRVKGLTASGITDYEVTLDWVDTNNTYASYTVYDMSDTSVVGYASGTTLTVSGLNANTSYTFGVQADCGSSTASFAKITVRTACGGSTSVPYSENFDALATGEMPNCWLQVQTGSSSASTFPAAYNYSSNSYSSPVYFEMESSTGETEVAALPQMDDIYSLRLRFRASMSSSYPCTLEVGVMEDNLFVPVDTVDLVTFSGTSSWGSNYHQYSVFFNNYTGTGDRIALRTTGTAGSQYTLMMDDFEVGEANLPEIEMPALYTATAGTDLVITASVGGDLSSMSYSWTSAMETAGLALASNLDNVYTINYTSGGTDTVTLIASNSYGSDTAYAVVTVCGNIAALPWNEGFEGHATGSAPACWIVYGGNPRVNSSSSNPHTGSQYLHFSGSYSNMIALPPFEDPINTMQVRFWTRPESFTSSNCGSFSVGYVTDIADSSTFVAVETYNYSDFSAYEEKEVPFGSAPDSAVAIAFRHNANSTVWYWYVDDLTVEPIPVCSRPTNITAVATSDSDVNVDIMGDASATYRVYWTDGTTVDSADVTGNTYTISGLTASTLYTVSAVTICDDGSLTNSASTTVRTQCLGGGCDLTFTMDDSYGDGWNGNAIKGYVNGVETFSATISDGYTGTYVYSMCSSDTVVLIWDEGSYPDEASFTVNNSDITISGIGDNFNDGDTIGVFYGCPTCATPTNLVIDSVSTDQIDFHWTSMGSETSWQVILNGTAAGIATSTSYSATGLTNSTTYNIAVRAICGDGDTSSNLIGSAQTLSIAATVPYSTGFESGDDIGWLVANNNSGWYVGSAASNTGSNGLYISNDNGVSNSYTSNSNISYAYKLFHISTPGVYAVSFDWRCHGEGSSYYYDYLRAFVAPETTTFTAGSSNGIGSTGAPAGWTSLDGDAPLNLNDNWLTQVGSFTVTGDTSFYVVFYWHDDASVANQPPAAIDNIEIAELTCPWPTDFTVDAIDGFSATVSWTPVGSESEWSVSLNGGTPVVVSTTPSYTFTGLTPTTDYTVSVRALCSSTDSSFALNGSFTTLCATYTLPFAENFDSITSIADLACWERFSGLFDLSTNSASLTSTSNGWTTTTTAMDGSRHAKVNIYGSSCKYWLVSPSINLTVPANLTFRLALTDYYYADPIEDSTTVGDDRFYVLVSNDGGSNWAPLATWGNSYTSFDYLYNTIPNTSDTISLNLGAYTGQTVRIAFYGESTASGGDNDLHIDDIMVGTGGAICNAPTINNVNATDVEVSFGIVSPSDTNEVVIMAGDLVEPTTNGTVITTINHTFSGLTPNTQYTFGVRAVCAEGFYSAWTYVTFTTADRPCDVPTGINVTEIEYTRATVTWTATDPTQNSWEVHVFNNTFNFYDTIMSVHFDMITNLTPGLTYYATVRALCATNYYSEWSDTVSFTTDTCAVPTGLAASQVTANSAVISWNGTGAVKYELEYGDRNFNQGFGTLVTVEGGATTYTLTGLEQQNPYDVYVRAYCTETLYSGWSAVAHFTTTEGEGINDVSGADINLYPNPATASVTLTGIEGEATVTIVDLNGRTVYTTTASSSLTIDLTGYAKGAYFVRVTGEQTTAIRKLIVK